MTNARLQKHAGARRLGREQVVKKVAVSKTGIVMIHGGDGMTQWLISGAALLLIIGWLWFIGAAESEQPDADPVVTGVVQPKTQVLVPAKEPAPSGQVQAVVHNSTQAQESVVVKSEQAKSICLEGRGCTLDLQENWHLRLISANKELSRAKLELLFKSKNFREAAEQLHYSHQYPQDNQLEQNLEQALSDLEDKFDAGAEALGCRDNICLVQLRLPIEIKADEVLKQFSGMEPSWQHIYMSELKTKTYWQIRLLVKAELQP
jgi:hypothetical protein